MPHSLGGDLIVDRDFADYRSRRSAIMQHTYEDWLGWIVLSLCGGLLLFGLIQGA